MADIEKLNINGTDYSVRDSRIDDGRLLSQQDILNSLGVTSLGKTFYRHNIVLCNLTTKNPSYLISGTHYYSFITLNILTEYPTPIVTRSKLIDELINQGTTVQTINQDWDSHGYLPSRELTMARGKIMWYSTGSVQHWDEVLGLYAHYNGTTRDLYCGTKTKSIIYNPSSTSSWASTYNSYVNSGGKIEISDFEITDIVEEI